MQVKHLIPLILPIVMLISAGCNRNQTPAKWGPEDPQNLIKIDDAPNVCPAHVCPLETKIYRKNGEFVGKVEELGAKSITDPNKLAMRIKHPREVFTILINPDETRYYYVKR